MKKQVCAIILWAASIFFCVPIFVQAATVTVISSTTVAMIGRPFRIEVALDTQGDDMNAIQGTVSFPSNLFSLRSINDGNSIVSFWVTPPEEIASGSVTFSGIVPGGFEGSANSVLSLILTPVTEGTATISVDNLELLKNDGQGSPIETTSTPEMVTVVPAVSSTASSAPSAPKASVIAPDPFTPMIVQNPNVYGGKYFLVFSTTDEGTGISYYQVLEVSSGGAPGSTASWQTATSPYLLQDQTLSSDIYVRAVDHAGNFIVEKLPAKNPKSGGAGSNPFGNFIALIIAVLLALVAVLFVGYLIIQRKAMIR